MSVRTSPSRPSMTGTDSFRLRIQRSEVTRAELMCGAYIALLTLVAIRRLLGGAVMSDNHIFFTTVGVLGAALAYDAFVVYALRAAMRQGRLISGWRLHVNAIFEICVPASLMTFLHVFSPGSQLAALSAPGLLLFPLTLLLSVMRLRPRTTFWLGIAAGAAHAALVIDTLRHQQIPHAQYPVLFSYSAMLILIGIAGAVVTRVARQHVAEAVAEAEAHQRTGTRLATIEHDLEIARQIQTGLLPAASPRFPGFDIAGMNKPAEQTGGDYYDFQELPNGRLLAVMADVTGHGIGPALVMAVCRAYSRASAPLDMNPSTLMGRLNMLLHADMTTGRFITLAMAVLDRSGEVELVSAGHGPSLLYHAADRRVEQFGGDGLPLAVMADEIYGPSRAFTMQPDDVLVMLTDGVIEWQDSGGKQYGPERLAAAVAAAATKSAAEIVQSLHKDVLTHSGGTAQLDDVTIVVIKRT